jgi:hypothetical protein
MGVINWLVPMADMGEFSLNGDRRGVLGKGIEAIARNKDHEKKYHHDCD